jgi:hypothetical protein
MPDWEPNIDREASDAVKRIERQMFVEGRLDEAVAAEGAGILFLPILLGAAGLVGWILTSLGLEGPELIFVGVPALIGLGVLALYLGRKK